MKYLFSFLFTCAWLISHAQVNYVKNPELEQYSRCPDDLNAIVYCTNWSNIKDSTTINYYQPEYYNACGNAFLDGARHIPYNTRFYQYPHSDSGMGGFHLYYDKTPPSPPLGLPFDYRDYLQGRLFKPLVNGKTYCVSFWVNATETSYYGQNKIGAYLDNGAINKLPLPPGSEVTSVVPQVYTNDIIKDTANWVKIEGSFVANGTETHITIGNFFPNSAVDTVSGVFGLLGQQYSYYLIDDVSVVAIDAKANAGPDRWVAIGNSTDIGPVEDSTARGMECHWYYKGNLIDSGNVITVNAASSINQIDTYVVVQNVCGTITRDTMLLKTTSLSISPSPSERVGERLYTLSPNPNQGDFVLHQKVIDDKMVSVKVYNALGSVIYNKSSMFTNGMLRIDIGQQGQGVYLICIGNQSDKTACLRFTVK